MDNQPTDEVLAAKAERIIALSDQMDETFKPYDPSQNRLASKAHRKLAIMAGLLDMYRTGFNEGYVDGANTYDENRRKAALKAIEKS